MFSHILEHSNILVEFFLAFESSTKLRLTELNWKWYQYILLKLLWPKEHMLIIDSVLVNASKLIEKEKIILCCNYKFRLELVEHNSYG